MPGSVIPRQGRVVETHAGPVVRFPADCSADGFCACAWQSRAARQVAAAELGLADDARPGRAVTLLVEDAALTRLAGLLFALPVAALVAAGWSGVVLAGHLGWSPDFVAALLGLGALGLTFTLIARNGGALLRMLKMRAHVE